MNSSSSDAETAALPEILHCWMDAIGGAERISQIDVVRIRRTVEMSGLEGTLEEWATADGRYRKEFALGDGIYSQIIVLDGTSGWQLDHNGKVTVLSGGDLTEQRLASDIAAFRHLRQGNVEDAGVDAESGLRVVHFAPGSDAPITYFLDPVTFRPVRSAQPSHDQTMTVHFDGWESFQDVSVATAERQSTGDERYDASFTVTEVSFDAEPPAGTFDRPTETADDARFTQGSRAKNIPLEVYGEHIFVEATVEDRPAQLLLDTGAGATVLDTDHARAMGLNLEGKLGGRGAGETTVEASLVKDVTFSLPGVALVGQTIVTVPLSPLAPRFGRALHGALGFDFLSRFVVTIDYALQRMHLTDPESFTPPPGVDPVPIWIENSHPHVRLMVTPHGGEPIEADLLIDTGASTTMGFTRPFTEEHDLLSTLPDRAYFVGGGGVGGESKSHVGRLARIEVGPHVFENVVCGFSDDAAGAGADRSMSGLLGGGVLDRFTVTFDYGRGFMYLEPNETVNDPFEWDMCGAQIESGGPGAWRSYRVYRVGKGSAAEDAGVLADDAIVSIDGRPASSFSMPELADHFKREGEEIRLEVERGGEKVTKTFRLKRCV